jgi:hypothetical protein
MRRFVPLLIALTAFFALAPPARAAWVWPVTGEVITQYRNGTDPYATGQHRGIDIAAPVGTPVVAAAGGEVRFAGTAGSSGLTVGIRTGDGYDTSYLHLSSLSVRAGAEVSAGERIGAVGTTGDRSAAAPHLHFGVRDAGTRHDYHDPLALLQPPPPPAGALDPQPPAPGPAPEPAPPAAAPVPLAAPTPHAVPRGRPHPVPHGRPHSAPHRLPHAVPHAVAHRLPLAAPHGRPLAAPHRVPLAAPHRSLHTAPAAARRPHFLRAAGQPGPPVSRADTGSPHASLYAGPDRPAATSDADGPDPGWLAACAGLLFAAGLLGMTGGARRRPGWAFSLANWNVKTPNPAHSSRG